MYAENIENRWLYDMREKEKVEAKKIDADKKIHSSSIFSSFKCIFRFNRDYRLHPH
jgi:hypothetical protein